MLIEKLRRLADDLENIDQEPAGISPQVAMTSWALGRRTAPCLIGRPVGHPNISDGRLAYSSQLFYLDMKRGIARTMSRWYSLGTRVDAEYWDERFRETVGPFGDVH
jgi:hypothetical protein